MEITITTLVEKLKIQFNLINVGHCYSVKKNGLKIVESVKCNKQFYPQFFLFQFKCVYSDITGSLFFNHKNGSEFF
jgi:hypothetical protein